MRNLSRFAAALFLALSLASVASAIEFVTVTVPGSGFRLIPLDSITYVTWAPGRQELVIRNGLPFDTLTIVGAPATTLYGELVALGFFEELPPNARVLLNLGAIEMVEWFPGRQYIQIRTRGDEQELEFFGQAAVDVHAILTGAV